MHNTALLDALSNSPRFIVYRTEPVPDKPGKLNKIPTHPFTGYDLNSQDPAGWLLPYEALAYAEALEVTRAAPVLSYGVGLMIYEGGGIFCIDLDSCRDERGGWLPHVIAFQDRFPGAALETSVSGNGRHIFGLTRGPITPHSQKNKTYRMEAYSARRFIAITGADASGNVLTDLTDEFNRFVEQFFAPTVETPTEWTTAPVSAWRGPADDAELLRRAMASGRDKQMLFRGAKATFADLYNADADVIERIYGNDESSVDQGLANHLAFWTGSNCERMLTLMRGSALTRPKWDREDYLPMTILKATASQTEWYSDGYSPTAAAPQPVTEAAVTLNLTNVPSPPPISVPAGTPPPASGPAPPPLHTAPMLKSCELPPIGEYVTVDQQQQIFAGMCYVTDIIKVQMPAGSTLNKSQFSDIFGGRLWGIKADGQAPSKDAWDAFVRSEIHDFPKVHTQFFSPKEATGVIRSRDGIKEINSYVPAVITRQAGDASPFVTFVKTLLPNGTDAEILIYWMAAATRYIGTKFTWAPFIQGVKGNGKTTLGEIMEYCLSPQYTHWAKPTEIAEKFNNVFSNKLLVIVDEAKTHDQAELQEILKLMVTAKRIEVRPMFAEKLMKDVCYNMMLISNYKNAVRIDSDERRYAPFYCAQQKKAHNIRDGLDPQFFVRQFRPWLFEQGGLAIIYDYLMSLDIPDQYDPSRACVIAPITSSTADAITASLGPIEQEILHAVKLGKEGFKGGWISSGAVDVLLMQLGKDKFIPRNARADLVMSLGYVPHPSLEDGLIATHENNSALSTLYVQRGHAWDLDYLTAEQVRAGYLSAQK